MDHLPLPNSRAIPREGPMRVPFVCANRHDGEPYDGGDFLTYPNRAGKPQVIPRSGRPSFAWLEMQNPSDDESDLEPFLQSWIFFGLLHELLSPGALSDIRLYRAADFCEDGFVHTSSLSSKIGAWLELVRVTDQHAQAVFAARLAQCLELANQALRFLTPAASERTDAHSNFHRGIRFSLAAIGETISYLCEVTFDGDGYPKLEWTKFAALAEFNEAERAYLRRIGWCPNVLANAERSMNTIAGHQYLRYMRMPLSYGVHDNCTEKHCSLMQINPETYRPRHSDPTCTCDLLGPDPADVANCLESQTYPVLEISGSSIEDIIIRAIPFKSETETPYVALSHVWADGLGNPSALELPRCQLLHLCGLVEGLRGRTYKWQLEGIERKENRKLLLWCDSLLCPIERSVPADIAKDLKALQAFRQQPDVLRASRLKVAAIAKMVDVYQNSAYTLVLDRSLTSVAVSDAGMLEATVKVLVSGWSQRLWTYQESVLPNKLLIQFADGAFDLRDLWQYARDCYQRDPAAYALYRGLVSSCAYLRYRPTRGILQQSLLLVQADVGRRGRSKDADEPLCTATLLGLDTGQVASSQDGRERMAKFWELLCQTESGIPDNIVFNNFPRLDLPGYRWAPSTFRRDLDPSTSFLADPDGVGRATLTENGVRVSRPAWRIQVVQRPHFASTLTSNVALPEELLYVKGKDGYWYSIVKPDDAEAVNSRNANTTVWGTLAKFPSADWTLILDNGNLHDERKSHRALLGYFESQKSGARTFKTQMLVAITIVGSVYSKITTQAEADAQRLRRTRNFRLYQLCILCDRIVSQTPLWLFPIVVRMMLHSRLAPVLRKWYRRLVLDLMLVSLPTLARRFVNLCIGPALRRWHEKLVLELLTCLKRFAADIFVSDDVRTFFKAMNPDATSDSLVGHFL